MRVAVTASPAKRPRGRPPTSEGARPHMLTVRLSVDEQAALDSLCKLRGLPTSDVVRAAILAAYDRR